MSDTLKAKIVRHLEILSRMRDLSSKILEASLASDIETTFDLLSNRERLLNIVIEFQSSIEQEINNLDNTDQACLEVIKSWNLDTIDLSNKITALDKSISESLENLKESTTKEIASVYKAKQTLKSYNLNDVKK